MQNIRTWLTVVAVGCAVIASTPPTASAKKLADAEIRIEINDTDGDAGIHVLLDGVGWDTMQCIGPDGNVLFNVLAESSVAVQGITEFFFESAEPSFDVQTLEELLALFPEGEYEFRGTQKDGSGSLRGTAELTHAIPAGPRLLSPIDGEKVDPDNAVFSWEAVADPPGSEIVAYEIIGGCEKGPPSDFQALVGPDVTSITVAPEILRQGGKKCKWEVLAIEDSANQTLTESEFRIGR